MVKDKVFVFGASVGGQNYIKRAKGNLEILGYLDNDEKKQGTKVLGFKVYSPTILLNIDIDKYDYIVITSMYIDSIIQQLNELGVPQEKIKFPPKTMLKSDKRPFEELNMRNRAAELLCNLCEVLKEQSYFISFGTLLGIVRENQLLPWDDDIDISIFPNEVDVIISNLVENIDSLSKYYDFKIFLRRYSDIKIANISIHCYYQDEDLFHISLACLNENDENKEFYTQEVNITPKKYFDEYDVINFNGNKLKVPKNYIGYLEYTYGDWKVPKKNTSFFDNSLSYKETDKVTQTITIYDYTLNY